MAAPTRCQHCGEPLPAGASGSQRCPNCGKMTLLKRPPEERVARWHHRVRSRFDQQTKAERRATILGIAAVIIFLLAVLFAGL